MLLPDSGKGEKAGKENGTELELLPVMVKEERKVERRSQSPHLGGHVGQTAMETARETVAGTTER
eukprot:3877563-Prorocentrum_lima.AAC.1